MVRSGDINKRIVDFDGTLVEDSGWQGFRHIGLPIPKMIEKVREWLSHGDKVILFTARLSPCAEFDPTLEGMDYFAIKAQLENWCEEHLGRKLEVTNLKQGGGCFYDDFGRHVVRNTGRTSFEHLVKYLEDLKQLAALDSETYTVSAINSIIQKIKELEVDP
jgi:hypothetical protein